MQLYGYSRMGGRESCLLQHWECFFIFESSPLLPFATNSSEFTLDYINSTRITKFASKNSTLIDTEIFQNTCKRLYYRILKNILTAKGKNQCQRTTTAMKEAQPHWPKNRDHSGFRE